jgi:DNA-binding transcriptional MerR regulator
MIDIQSYLGSSKIFDPELFTKLKEDKFNAGIFGKEITYRTLNYWGEKGYLLIERDNSASDWRKLSFTDYIWMRMLDELRQMNISVEGFVKVLFRQLGIRDEELESMPDAEFEKLKELSFEELLPNIDKKLVSTRFCLFLVNIVSFKTRLSLRVFKNGEYDEVYSNPSYHGLVVRSIQDAAAKRRELSNYQSFISVSISDLISEYIETKDLDNISGLNILSSEEKELLKHVRNKDLKEITVTLSDGMPSRLALTEEVKQNADTNKRIYEEILSDYTEISYKTNGDKQVSFKRTTKIKL